MIDLGRWLSGGYRVPGDPVGEPREGTASPDDDDES
jgi:endogenous inhibitor of DNA gyrase (YacG/DUF329 family)